MGKKFGEKTGPDPYVRKIAEMKRVEEASA